MNEYLSLAHAGEKTQGREDGRGLVKVNFLIRRRDVATVIVGVRF